jgi:hypothetical protein
MKYPKIQTIWKRDEKNNFAIIEGDPSKEEFTAINSWHITEKIDGMNIRVVYDNIIEYPDSPLGDIRLEGRTDKAQIPKFLLEYLEKTFTPEKFRNNFDMDCRKIILFGEGYGPKIQKGGGLYRDDVSFALFDVWLDNWWLKQDSIDDIAKKFEVERAPAVGIMSTQKAINFIKSRPPSIIAKDKTKPMEGIVCRSHPLMLFRDGTPIMWKLKIEDHEKLEKAHVL